jgi:putative hydrolase of the HAD superfamily
MIKAIFFDLYGTMIDIRTDEDDYMVYEMLSRYISYHSVSISAEELKRAYSERVKFYLNKDREEYPEIDVYKIFFEIIHGYGKKRYSRRIISDISMLFRSLTIRRFGVFDNLYDVLVSLLKKYKIAIISDAQWVFAEPEMAILGLDRFFKTRILSSKFGFKKPDIRLFHHAMKKLGVTPGESIFIGDNPSKDLVGAKKAGMNFVFFRGECKEYEGFKPDGCFYNYKELENVLNTIK